MLKKRPKALLLDFNVRYVNPTRSHLPKLLHTAFELTAFGPGYVSDSVLKSGIEAFVEDKDFDLLIATEHVVLWAEWLSAKGYQRCYAMDFDPNEISNGRKLLEFFSKYSGKKLTLLMESDFYNFNEWQIQRIEGCGGYFAAWGEEFIYPVEELRELEGVNLPETATNNWLDFCIRNRSRIASTLHYIDNDEFCYLPLEQRPDEWSVLGAPYAARVRARSELALHGKKFQGRYQAIKVSVLSRIFKAKVLSPDILIKWMQDGFKSSLNKSKYGYTCGAFVRQPIRKFFEIPAAGCVLVCQPFKGHQNCGYIDGKTHVGCEPENILEVDNWLINNPEEAQRIAYQGRSMVLSLHSLEARADQIRDIGSAIIAGTFSGASWSDGKLRIL